MYSGRLVTVSKDINPHSPTYNQYKFEYSDDRPECSPIPDFQLVEGDKYRDENPGSPFYGIEFTFTDSTPTWENLKEKCHEETYQPSGAVGQDGTVECIKVDINPKSATYQNTTDWEIEDEPEIECSAVDTDPILDFQSRTVVTEQNPWNVNVPTGEVINSYLDVNKYSSTYGSTTTEEGFDENLVPDKRVKYDKDYGFQELHYELPINVRWVKNLYSPFYNAAAICLPEDNVGVWPEGAMKPGYVRMTSGFSVESENVGGMFEGDSLGEGGWFFNVGFVDLYLASNAGQCSVDPDYMGANYLKFFEYDQNTDESGVDRSEDVLDLQLGYIRHYRPYLSLENFTNLRNLDLTWSDYDGLVQCDLSQNARLLKISMTVDDINAWDQTRFANYINDNFTLDYSRSRSFRKEGNTLIFKYQ